MHTSASSSVVPPAATVVEQLRARLRGMRREQQGENDRKRGASTGIAPLDALVSPSLFRPGMIVEWVMAAKGARGALLAIPMIQQALAGGGGLLVIDERREFYPPAALRLGLDLERTIVIRPANSQETLWALEQSLCCSGVGATLAWVGNLPDRQFRRLQLAAERGGGLGVLIRPAEVRRMSSWADLRWFVQPIPGGVRVELLHCREGFPGGAVNLEINDETGAVHLVSPVAAPANLPRAARA